MDDVSSLVNAQITEMGITHRTHRGELTHTRLISSPLRLRQIMLNLFSNAIKLQQAGRNDRYVCGRSLLRRNRVVYEFRITDSGIRNEQRIYRKELFHPFHRRSPVRERSTKGTGLGMSIVKELIEKCRARSR